MIPRRVTDIIFAWLFRAFSFTGVAALGAIVLFIFIQGAQPFLFPGAHNLRLVIERFDHITVNGQVYENPEGFIELPWDTQTVSVQFVNQGEEQSLDFRLAPQKKGRTSLLRPIEAGEGTVTFPDAYTCSVSYPGIMAGLTQKIHIILPEPPYNFFSFLGGMEWLPAYQKKYGIFPMILGTVFVCFGALLLGVPVAILCALFMAEFLPKKVTSIFRSGVELLAGIPSVVYGFFGLMVIVPLVKKIFTIPSGNSLLSAMLVLTIMILPTIIAVSEKSLQAVPRSRREASLAMGASKMQTALHVVLPHARSGVLAGIILGFSRAVGETMAVILVAGNSVQLIKTPLEGVRTLTATIALEMGYAEGRHSQMLFAIGIVLLVMVLILNGLILLIRRQEDE
ncbi:MAG: phosphate ABC transporter permease subunit PstC [Treponema sp.]|jgi:phosphate transport system permease protein|nr:phosphate ABC transporter permease subunit PstC [Treponema sp.]